MSGTRTTGAVRRVLGRAAAPVHRHQVHGWAWTPLRDGGADAPLPAGFELREAVEADLPLLRQVDADFPAARRLLAAGHRLWLVRDRDRVACSAWTFIGQAPTDASRTGWVALPAGTVNHEDVTTHPDFRGHGVAGAASARIAAQLVREGVATRAVTTFLVTNTSSRRAMAKGGMMPFAVLDVTKVGWLRRDRGWRNRRADRRLTVTRLRLRPADPGVPGSDELFRWLAAALAAGVAGPAAAGSPAPASAGEVVGSA